MKLRRITSHGNWIPEIDGLRFVAITVVVLGHIFNDTLYHFVNHVGSVSAQTLQVTGALFQRAPRGVPLFFAISGFILAQPFLRQHLLHGNPVSIKGYFKRRLTRLEPPYILSLLIYAAARFADHHIGARILGQSLLAHLFYVHNFVALPAINFVTWSLEIEVQFYIVAPILGLIYSIPSAFWRRSLMCLLILGSMTFRIFHPSVAAVNLPGTLQYFLVGFLLADLRATRTHSQSHRWWDLVSLVSWIAIFAVNDARLEWLFPVCILCAYLGAFYGPVFRSIFSTGWIALTGGMCYSFYLMHMLVISTGLRATQHLLIRSSYWLSALVQILVLVPVVFAVCTLYFVLIERPCMDPAWPHKLALRVSALLRSSRQASATVK